MTSIVSVSPNTAYRARVVLSGVAAFASNDRIRDALSGAGFDSVVIWDRAEDLPADWPEDKRANVADTFEKMVWGQGAYFPREVVICDPEVPPEKCGAKDIPAEGTGWRIHDLWVYLRNVARVPPGPVEGDDEKVTCSQLVDEADRICETDPQSDRCARAVDAALVAGCFEDEENPPGGDGEEPPGDDDKDPPVGGPPSADVGAYAGRPPGNLDRWAVSVVIEALHRELGLDYVSISPVTVRLVQSVARAEDNYGWPEKHPNYWGHHNWGCVTAICGPGTFTSKDGMYVDGKWQPHDACFASHATNLEGAQHFVRVLLKNRRAVRDTMGSPSTLAFARAMRDTSYFCRQAGRDKNGNKSCAAATDKQKGEDAAYYATAIYENAAGIARSVGGPVLVDPPPGYVPKVPGGGPFPPGPVTPIGAVTDGPLILATTLGLVGSSVVTAAGFLLRR